MKVLCMRAVFCVMVIQVAIANTNPAPNPSTINYSTMPSASASQVRATAHDYSAWFGAIFDARMALKTGDSALAQKALDDIDGDFNSAIMQALHDARTAPSEQNLAQLSTLLYNMQQSEMPYTNKAEVRTKFAQKMSPAYQALLLALDDFGTNQNSAALKNAYDTFNQTWVSAESAMRTHDKSRYGKMELNMALLRAQIEGGHDITTMRTHIDSIGTLIDGFAKGQVLTAPTANTTMDNATMDADINSAKSLLVQARSYYANKQDEQGAQKISDFLQNWADIELEIRRYDLGLYRQIEQDLPLVLAKGAGEIHTLDAIIAGMDSMGGRAYGAFDVALILLREGVEALLIVMALVLAMGKAGQSRAKAWVYIGALAGLTASALVAYFIGVWFPKAQASREFMEGVVGIVAVAVMLFIGAWLHSKSNMRAWTAFIQKHSSQALATGGFLALASTSFLAVFREGAETVLFYAGILPYIKLGDFWLGIVCAFAILAIIAIIMQKFAGKIALHKLFGILGLVIYVLGFKILGVSIHALQLIGALAYTAIDIGTQNMSMPNIEWIGLYSSWQGIGAQGLYVILAIMLYFKHKSTSKNA